MRAIGSAAAAGSYRSGWRMPSRRPRNVCSSSHGMPIRPRNTADGNCSANSSVKLHSPRSMNWSMKWLARSATSPSIASMRFGANSGSRILRYVACFGGSMFSGISGRTLPSGMSTADENNS